MTQPHRPNKVMRDRKRAARAKEADELQCALTRSKTSDVKDEQTSPVVAAPLEPFRVGLCSFLMPLRSFGLLSINFPF